MLKRRLKYTDKQASSLVLGTALFGSTIAEADAFRMLDVYQDAGGNFLDTSLNYADWHWPVPGISEQTIGKWMKDRGNRQQIVIGTKGACPLRHGGPFLRLTREHITNDLHDSLRNLQTDSIDLYYLHRDDPSKPVAEIIGILEEQVQAGIIRSYACSNWTLPRLEEAQQYALKHGKQGFAVNQMMWSLAEVNRSELSDQTLVSMDDTTKLYHHETGLAAVPYSSQANGFFTGRYEGETDTPTGRLYGNEANFIRLREVLDIARETRASGTAVALAYMLSAAHGFDVFPVIGPKNAAQLEDSLQAAELKLDAPFIRRLEAIG